MFDVRDATLFGDALIERLRGLWPPGVSFESRTRSWVYKAFPFLFADAFPQIARKDLDALAAALRFISDAAVLTDRVIDGADPIRVGDHALSAKALEYEAYRLLYDLFPPSAKFWDRLRTYFGEFASVCVQEHAFAKDSAGWTNCGPEKVMEIARGKAALAKSVAAALVDLARDDAYFEPLQASIEECHFGVQLIDDVRDWRQDYLAGIPTYPLIQVVSGRPRAGSDDLAHGAVERVGRQLFYGDHASRTLEIALAAFDRAVAVLEHVPVHGWKARVELSRHECDRMLSDLRGIARSNVTRVKQRPSIELGNVASDDPWLDEAGHALRYLAAASRTAFGESRWLMRYPIEFDPTGTRPTQSGDVLQRAIITDALCDARTFFGSSLDSLVASELQYLLGTSDRDVAGGWRIFPTIPEIPQSMLVLGEVAALTERLGTTPPHARRAIDEVLGALASQGERPDVRFSGWLPHMTVDAGRSYSPTVLEEDRRAVLTANARLCAALVTSANSGANRLVEQRMDWIVEQQAADGSWESLYAAYYCLRFMLARSPQSEAIGRAAEFVRRAQTPTGGWGWRRGFRPTAFGTSMALLALHALADSIWSDPEDWNRATRGRDFLRTLRDSSGRWPRTCFVEMSRWSHGSRSLTTAFVLKALLAWAGTSDGAVPSRMALDGVQISALESAHD
ncbi:MAG TPA: hypothetical protein VIP11_09055 [Gemmatimonadaceae bacterium]